MLHGFLKKGPCLKNLTKNLPNQDSISNKVSYIIGWHWDNLMKMCNYLEQFIFPSEIGLKEFSHFLRKSIAM